MPRGKIGAEHLAPLDEDKLAADEYSQSKPAAKFVLVDPEPEEDSLQNETEFPGLHFPEHTNSHTLNFKFTLLLLLLFVIVSAGLALLLGDNKNMDSLHAAKEENAAAQNAVPSADITEKAALQTSVANAKSVADKPVINSPAVENPPAQKLADMQPAKSAIQKNDAEQDLLSIISKD